MTSTKEIDMPNIKETDVLNKKNPTYQIDKSDMPNLKKTRYAK